MRRVPEYSCLLYVTNNREAGLVEVLYINEITFI